MKKLNYLLFSFAALTFMSTLSIATSENNDAHQQFAITTNPNLNVDTHATENSGTNNPAGATGTTNTNTNVNTNSNSLDSTTQDMNNKTGTNGTTGTDSTTPNSGTGTTGTGTNGY